MKYRKDLTPAQITAYMSASDRCPFCRSSEIIRISESSFDGDRLTVEWHCEICHRTWFDIYTHTSAEAASQVCPICTEILTNKVEVNFDTARGLVHSKCVARRKPL